MSNCLFYYSVSSPLYSTSLLPFILGSPLHFLPHHTSSLSHVTPPLPLIPCHNFFWIPHDSSIFPKLHHPFFPHHHLPFILSLLPVFPTAPPLYPMSPLFLIPHHLYLASPLPCTPWLPSFLFHDTLPLYLTPFPLSHAMGLLFALHYSPPFNPFPTSFPPQILSQIRSSLPKFKKKEKKHTVSHEYAAITTQMFINDYMPEKF